MKLQCAKPANYQAFIAFHWSPTEFPRLTYYHMR